jgi:LacI family transcriptional regulator
MAVTIIDIAKALHLSKGTVSRILSGKGDLFSEATRQRVLAAAAEAGYRPSHVARALSTGRTGIVALWLWSDGRQDSYHDRVSHAMQGALLEYPDQLLISPVGQKILEFARNKTLSPWDVDGIVAHEASPAVAALLGRDHPYPVPIVSTGSYNLLPDVDTVGIDLREGAEEAVRHLLAPGRRRVAYLAERSARHAEDVRARVYVEVMGEAGLETELIFAPDVSRGAARQAIREHVSEKGLPEAIFCHNDTLAIGTCRGLRDLGARVPDDVALVGCDGIEDTEFMDVPISTIVQPLDEMATLALQYLRARLQDPEAPIQLTWLRPHLVIRESSRVSPAPRPAGSGHAHPAEEPR